MGSPVAPITWDDHSLPAGKAAPHRAVIERVTYDTSVFPFAAVLAFELQVRDLRWLHKSVAARLEQGRQRRPLDSRDNFAERDKLARLADDSPFYKVLRPFISRVLRPLFEGRMSYSAHPTFRVHMPQTAAVSDWHRDTQVTGRHDQVTAWIPFVDTEDTNTIWVERTYGARDHAPIAVRHGEVLLLDTSYLWHGSVTNVTDATRVSIDLRMSADPRMEEPVIGRILGARPPGYRVEREPA